MLELEDTYSVRWAPLIATGSGYGLLKMTSFNCYQEFAAMPACYTVYDRIAKKLHAGTHAINAQIVTQNQRWPIR